MPAQRSIPGKFGGQWYRPRAQKLMIVDLVKPFVWPERPSEEDMTPWDHKLFVAVEKGHSKEVAQAEAKTSWGPQKLRTDEPVTLDRKVLKKMAAQLLSGKQQWSPGPRGYIEVETDETMTATTGGNGGAPAEVSLSENIEAVQAESSHAVEADAEAVSKRAKDKAKEPVAENFMNGQKL